CSSDLSASWSELSKATASAGPGIAQSLVTCTDVTCSPFSISSMWELHETNKLLAENRAFSSAICLYLCVISPLRSNGRTGCHTASGLDPMERCSRFNRRGGRREPRRSHHF